MLENRKWANELEQFNVPKPGPAPVPNEGAAASAMYRAFEKAGCSKEFVRVYADVQERFKKQVAKLADGRLFMISIVLPELDAAAREFNEDGQRLSLYLRPSKAHPIRWSVQCRDAPRHHHPPLEMESRKLLVNRMCPKCYCGPIAEGDCGKMKLTTQKWSLQGTVTAAIASVLAMVSYRHNELHMSLPLESLNSRL